MDDTSHGSARQGAPHGLPLQGGGGAPNVAAGPARGPAGAISGGALVRAA